VKLRSLEAIFRDLVDLGVPAEQLADPNMRRNDVPA
jgi:hypothetical protein